MITCLFAALIACGSADAAGSGGINAPGQLEQPYLVLISIDGFRWDYQDQHDTPALDRIAANGVRAEGLIPVFPTLTFPNHYSIATGLYPVNHGIIGNTFPDAERRRWYSIRDRDSVEDGSWYRGEPIWVTAETNGMVSAAFFFVGTEADVQGVPPTYWNSFDESIPGERRVDQVLQWLRLPEERRPHVITLYFEDVDNASHQAGPESRWNAQAVSRVDGYLSRLLEGIDRLEIAERVYYIIVSDHGQARYRRNARRFAIESIADLDGIAAIDHGAICFLYFDEPDKERAAAVRDAINAAWRHGRAWLPGETPDAWQLDGTTGIADVIAQADIGYEVVSYRRRQRTSTGDHGWAPEEEDMHGVFIASGARLPSGERIPAIRAVDIYPLMATILKLPMPEVMDGDPELLPSLLTDR